MYLALNTCRWLNVNYLYLGLKNNMNNWMKYIHKPFYIHILWNIIFWAETKNIRENTEEWKIWSNDKKYS